MSKPFTELYTISARVRSYWFENTYLVRQSFFSEDRTD